MKGALNAVTVNSTKGGSLQPILPRMTELLVCETLCETTDFTECKCGYLLVVELKNRKVSSTAVLLRGTVALAAAPLIL